MYIVKSFDVSTHVFTLILVDAAVATALSGLLGRILHKKKLFPASLVRNKLERLSLDGLFSLFVRNYDFITSLQIFFYLSLTKSQNKLECLSPGGLFSIVLLLEVIISSPVFKTYVLHHSRRSRIS